MPVFDVALFALRVDAAGEDGPDQDAEWVLNFYADPAANRGSTEFARFVDNDLEDLTIFRPSNPDLQHFVSLFVGPLDPNLGPLGPVSNPSDPTFSHYKVMDIPVLPIRTIVDTGTEPLDILITGHEYDEQPGAAQQDLPAAEILITQPTSINENTYTATALEAIAPNDEFRYIALLQITPHSGVVLGPGIYNATVFGPDMAPSDFAFV